MAQAVSRRPLNTEARVRSRASPCGICGGQSGTGTGFPLSISFHRCSITWKNDKKTIIFMTGLHNKPQGCSASVASAAGPFTTHNCYPLGSILPILNVVELSYDIKRTEGIHMTMTLHTHSVNAICSSCEFSDPTWAQRRPGFIHNAPKQIKQIHWWTTSPSALVKAAQNLLLTACSRPLGSYGYVDYLVTDAPQVAFRKGRS
jgi:hypothetical protein